jgi:hypothetical protein
MAKGGLVVADDGVVPIRDIERSVRSGLNVDGAEALVIGSPERGEKLAAMEIGRASCRERVWLKV